MKEQFSEKLQVTAIFLVLCFNISSLQKYYSSDAMKKWQNRMLNFVAKEKENLCKTAQLFPELICQ